MLNGLGTLAAAACVSVVAVLRGIRHQQYGVVIGGLVKIALELALCWYLLSPGTARVFRAYSSPGV